MTYDQGNSTHNHTWPSDHVVMWGHMTNEKQHISFSGRRIVTKRCRVLTCVVRRSPLKLHDSLITWSKEVAYQIETIMSPLFPSYGHQIWQSGDLWWQESTHGVTWPFEYAVLRGHVKNLKRLISSSPRPTVPKLCRVVIQGKRALPIKPHGHWIR